ncbi:MAG: transporter substrate-binding domain-containing protein [Treponema sp.]|jgi:L-cystine transport system substrate-binding protein|nr:transporter substrate-binding domain-containing protein [Treponema sp.]
MKNIKKITAFVLILAFVLTLAAACRKQGKDGGVKEIIIGTGSAYNPYCFLDEKGELTGFEKAVLDEVDKLLPQYKFTYKIFDFANILLSLESGSIDIGAHQFEFNTERAAKYLYGNEGYTTYNLYLVVQKDNNSIKTYEDLKGKVLVSTSTTSNAYYKANKWNNEHGNIFKLAFADSTPLMLEGIDTGIYDAFLLIERQVPNYIAQYNAKIKSVGEPVSFSDAYHIYNKHNGQQLKKDVDSAIVKLKENGALSRLSVEWLGEDVVPPVGDLPPETD